MLMRNTKSIETIIPNSAAKTALKAPAVPYRVARKQTIAKPPTDPIANTAAVVRSNPLGNIRCD